jgi:gas vesicle protein
MIHENQEYKYHTNNNILSILGGMLVGSLAGAVTMLLLAPQSGKDTRTQIQKKSIELRDRTTEVVGNTMTQVRSKANKITTVGLKDRSQEPSVEQEKAGIFPDRLGGE